MSDWTTDDARSLYNVPDWSDGYFDTSPEGHVVVKPHRDPARGVINLPALASDLTQAGLNLPVLVRFTNILHDRIDSLLGAFDRAMQSHEYAGQYTAVYPIKVNQQRAVVEEILAHKEGNVGLEAGSKPELMALLGLAPRNGLIICNGYKDREYIRRALMAKRLGHRVFIVLEKLNEIDLVIEESRALGIDPSLGVRVRLASLGAGKWQNTGGEKSKFGLSSTQLMQAVEKLTSAGMKTCLELLHFHMGSQISNVRDIRGGLTEAARYFTSLHELGVSIAFVDVGGGLGVDYEGTKSRSFCSINYSVNEYAHAVVHALKETCVTHDLPEPHIITEAGRAMTAHHAVLITQVMEVELPEAETATLCAPEADDPPILHDLWDNYENRDSRSPVEIYHDAIFGLTEARTMFTHGVINLAQRAYAERVYTATCLALPRRLNPTKRPHQDILEQLDDRLAAKYFCNFSVFQSLPDVWAIKQIFPIVPLQRLDQRPTHRGIIQDLTCDSDGCINLYVEQDGVTGTLPLHLPEGDEPYLIGFFMVGAYQEILGDIHNLFGDTDAVNVQLTPDGGYTLRQPERGDTADQLLAYVHFEPNQLMVSYREKVARAGLKPEEGERFLAELTAGLYGYTYLKR
ncbi:MAG: biosynthetic arginine decarboxylase [Pseudomonadota bacterium]|nr:biosynthetic arginine decarboxylase [Pseudomonadota bacterium]